MGNLVLTGATSGSSTIVPTDAVTATLTLPSATGTLLSTANPQSGSVIQTVSATTTTQTSTTSTSYQSTGHSVTITPKFSNSKILVTAQSVGFVNMAGSSQGGGFTIYRNNTTNLSGASSQLGGIRANGFSSDIVSTVCMVWLDSPATTSATTYTVYIESMAGAITAWCSSAGALINNGQAIIIAQEIAA